MNDINANPLWKKIFIALCIAISIIMPVISQQYAQNGDEDVEAAYGRDIWNYYLNGDKQALNYDNAHPNLKGLEFYGGQFDVITEGIHRLFPSWNIMDVRHFMASIFGVLLILFTGLLAFRLSNKSWLAASLSFLLLLFSPRIFGESMNNGKDIPFATGMVMGVYFLIVLLQNIGEQRSKLWKESLGLALSWAIVFGMRSAGGLLFFAYAAFIVIVWFYFNKAHRTLLFAQGAKLAKRMALFVIGAFILGFIIGLLTWPFGLQDPIGNVMVTLKELSNRDIAIRVLFEGRYLPSNEMPWYYEIKWIFITSPIIVLIAFLCFFPLVGKISRAYGKFIPLILIFCALFPLLYIIYKKSTVYDTWRHVFFVYPFFVIMAALSIVTIQSFLKAKLQWVPLAVTLLGMAPALFWTVSAHPNQYVYFNEFAGGTKGAFGYYDLDYYLTSSKQSAQWILKNVKRPPNGKKIKVLTNMEGLDNYFGKDTSWIFIKYARYYERSQHDWDYYVTYGRFVSEWQLQNGKWPPANAVFTVSAGGVPIGVVLERKNHDVFAAYNAMQKNDFATAVTLYQNYLKTDSTDEMVYMNYAIALASTGRIDEAIAAMQSALALDPHQMNFYQVLSQIYKAKGDEQNAQQTLMKGQSIMAEQQMED